MSVDVSNKFRVIEEIEDNWDDVRVLVINRKEFDEVRDDHGKRKLTDEEWETVKRQDWWDVDEMWREVMVNGSAKTWIYDTLDEAELI